MQEISIKIGLDEIEAGMNFAVPASEIPAGENISVPQGKCTLYEYIEEKAAGYYAVVYGMIRRIFKRFCAYPAGFLKNSAVKLLRCRMEKLAYAGGLRL